MVFLYESPYAFTCISIIFFVYSYHIVYLLMDLANIVLSLVASARLGWCLFFPVFGWLFHILIPYSSYPPLNAVNHIILELDTAFLIQLETSIIIGTA